MEFDWNIQIDQNLHIKGGGSGSGWIQLEASKNPNPWKKEEKNDVYGGGCCRMCYKHDSSSKDFQFQTMYKSSQTRPIRQEVRNQMCK